MFFIKIFKKIVQRFSHEFIWGKLYKVFSHPKVKIIILQFDFIDRGRI